MERSPATGYLEASSFESNPFTIPTGSNVGNVAQNALAFYSIRWVTTVHLSVMIISALAKRVNILKSCYMMACKDTYQDLKLEICILAF